MVIMTEILTERRKNTKRGSYAGVEASKETKEKVLKYLADNKIPTPIKSEKLHVTLLYSRKYLPNYRAAGKLDEPYTCKAADFTVWKTSPADRDRPPRSHRSRHSAPAPISLSPP